MVVAAALVVPVPPAVKVVLVILQALACGAALPTADALIWEMLGRGVAEARRGFTLSLAFGIGPILAAASSLGSQALLNDELRSRWLPALEHPWTFAALFGLAAPMMVLAAYLCSRCVVPLPDREPSREPFLQGVFGGLWDFLNDRVLLAATVVTILVYTGNTIDPNMNLYTREALGRSPEQEAGLQLFLRFSFKAVAGLLLGWMLSRTNPKAGLLVTATLFLASVIWAMLASGTWYLVAFGLYGAGELVGVYAPNYMLSASRQSQIRRNMAFVTMMMAPAAPAGYLFGAISTYFGSVYSPALGFKLSFAVCAAIMAAGILIALLTLPARPQPEAFETEANT
jgi:MFS family permease